MNPKIGAHLLACLLVVFTAMPSWALKGWKLQQTSDFYGDQVCYVSQDLLVIEIKKLGLKVFVTAPDYHMTGVNYATKCYARLSKNDSKSELFSNSRGESFVHKKFGIDKIAGITTEKYVLENADRPAVKAVVPASTIGGKTYNTVFWVAPEIKAPPEFTDVMMSMMQLPHGFGLPMRMTQYSKKGMEVISLDTTKVEKVTFPADLITVPKGYTRVKDEMTLLFTDSPNDELDGILRNVQKGARKSHRGPWVPGADSSAIDIPGGPLHSKSQKAAAVAPHR